MLRLVGEVSNLAGSFLRLIAYFHRWERDSTPTKADKTEKPRTNI